MNSKIMWGVAGLTLAVSSAAFGQATPALLTFTYTDLAGSYALNGPNVGEGTFTARASSISPLLTFGSVTRLVGPQAQAQFAAGFEATGQANAVFNISVTNKTAFTATGLGSFTLTDLDGDTVTGTIDGTWVRGSGGRTFFNGNLREVNLNNVSGTGMFDGTSGGGFQMGLGVPPPYSGALVQLFIRTGVGFFENEFSNNTTQTSGQIIPSPGAAALAGLGMIGLASRRRRA